MPNFPLFRSLGHRNFRLFFFGQGLSLIGTWLQQVAMSWLTYRLSGSPLLLGFVTFCQYIAVLVLAPIAGVLADRVDRRKALLITQSMMLAQALTLTVLTATGVIAVWQIAALAVVLGCASGFDIPLRHAMIARLVSDRAHLPNAIALNSLLINCARVVGPAVAGILIAWVGESVCFGLNTLSFGAVLYALTRMRWPAAHASPPPAGWFASWLEGAKSAFGFRPIRAALLLIALISGTVGTYSTLMPVFAKDVFGGDAHTLGTLLSAAGSGALLAALYLASRHTTRGLERVILVAGTTASLAMLLFAHTTVFALALPVAHRAGRRIDRRPGVDSNAGADACRRRQARSRHEPLHHGVPGDASVRQSRRRRDSALRGRGNRVQSQRLLVPCRSVRLLESAAGAASGLTPRPEQEARAGDVTLRRSADGICRGR